MSIGHIPPYHIGDIDFLFAFMLLVFKNGGSNNTFFNSSCVDLFRHHKKNKTISIFDRLSPFS